MVGLLHDELVVSRDGLQPPAPRAHRPRPDLVYTPLPVATWAALSASGELRHIPKPELVGYFAEAYHWVAVINRYESMALKLQFDPAGVLTSVTSAIARDAHRHALRSINEQLENVFDPTALQEVTEAVELADRTFAEIEAAIRAEGGTVPRR